MPNSEYRAQLKTFFVYLLENTAYILAYKHKLHPRQERYIDNSSTKNSCWISEQGSYLQYCKAMRPRVSFSRLKSQILLNLQSLQSLRFMIISEIGSSVLSGIWLCTGCVVVILPNYLNNPSVQMLYLKTPGNERPCTFSTNSPHIVLLAYRSYFQDNLKILAEIHCIIASHDMKHQSWSR